MHVLTTAPVRDRSPFVFRNDMLPAATVALALLVLLGLAAEYDRPQDLSSPSSHSVMLAGVLGAFELVFLYVLLRPWSYDGNWVRATAAALLFLPDVLVSAGLGLDGPILALHAVWVTVMELALTTTAAVSGAGRLAEHGSAPRSRTAVVTETT